MKKLFVAAAFLGFSVSGFSNEIVDSASFYTTKAIELAKARKVWEADRNFQKALKFNPSSISTRLEYGNYLIEQRKSFAAVEQFGKVLESDINHVLALQKMTDLSFMLRRWNDVVMYGNKLLNKPGSRNIKYMLGKSFYELENYGQSQKYLREALSEEPTKLEVVTVLGKVLIELSRYNEAIEVYKQTLKLDPANAQLTYELGLLYYNQDQEKEAVKYFELAMEKGYKTDLDYFENLGMAYLGFDMEKGLKNLNKVLESKPNDSEILFQIAQSYYANQKYQEAADAYYVIFKNDPNNTKALYMTGLAYQKKGDKNKGMELCDKAINLDPSLAGLKTQKFVF